MQHRHNNISVATLASVTAESVITAEPLPLEDLEDATVEEYKKLNDKVDNIISKIKSRKENKRKK